MSTSLPASVGPRRRARWPVLLVTGPILFALWLAAWTVAGEWRWSEAESRLPADTTSMEMLALQTTARLRAHSTPDEVERWSQILLLSRLHPENFGNVPHYGLTKESDLPPLPSPRGGWQASKSVSDFLNRMQPVVRLVEQSGPVEHPVWQPLSIADGHLLLEPLQDSRGVSRLLALEAEVAVAEREAERAMRAIQGLDRVARAFDWQLCTVGELVYVSALSMRDRAIGRSLAADLWSDDQLQQLAEMLRRPLELSPRFGRVIDFEQAYWAYWLHEASPLSLPSDGQAQRAMYLRAREFPTDSLWSLRAAARADMQRDTLGESRDAVQANILGLISAYERAEISRQLALLAVTVKQYRLAHGTWPDGLSQLPKVEGLDLDPRTDRLALGTRVELSVGKGNDAWLQLQVSGNEPEFNHWYPAHAWPAILIR